MSRGLRSALGLLLFGAGLGTVLLSPIGGVAAGSWAAKVSYPTPKQSATAGSCSALGCSRPATTTVRYTSGEQLTFCDLHAAKAPRRKSLGFARILAAPFFLVAVVLFAAGFAGPILAPVALFGRHLAERDAWGVLVVELLAIPGTWVGALLYAAVALLGR